MIVVTSKADPTPGRLFLWHVFKNPFEAGSTSAVGGYVKDVRVIVARFRAPQQLGSRIRLRPGSFNRKRSAAVQPRLMSKRMRERQNPAQTIGAHCVNRMDDACDIPQRVRAMNAEREESNGQYGLQPFLYQGHPVYRQVQHRGQSKRRLVFLHVEHNHWLISTGNASLMRIVLISRIVF